ncbi:MAG: FAD-binding protein [Lachnospiraceae bacterium]
MSLKIRDTIEECDVLVVGGGIAGLMAAIAAGGHSDSVLLADKGDTRRSGSGATGNDHFVCFIPEVHGADALQEILDEMNDSMIGGNADSELQRMFLSRTFEVVKDWDTWGINMQPHGYYEFNGHAFPERKRIFLKYDGHNQKAVLTKEARKRNVRLLNKTPILEFLKNDADEIIGAIGLSLLAEEPELVLISCKAIIAATGNTSRLYPSITPSQLFNTAHCPGNAGAGRAAAYRAGAKLINLEIPNAHAGPKYFERCGKATWTGVIADTTGKAIGPFVDRPTKELGDITADVWLSVFSDKMKDGTGPVYMNCTQTSPEDMEYMKWGLTCEGDTSLLDAMDAQGIDLSKDMVEFTKYRPMLIGRGIQIDAQAATNIKGLYAAGDEVGNFRCDISGAAIFGRIAGENAARFVRDARAQSHNLHTHPVVRQKTEFIEQLLSHAGGAGWQEFNQGIQQILNDYAGIEYVRSEPLLQAGLQYLAQLEKNAREEISVRTSHDLMRALECFDLLQIGRLLCLCALERKETRGLHKRSDYPFTNPLLSKKMLMIFTDENQAPVVQWRSMNQEYGTKPVL